MNRLTDTNSTKIPTPGTHETGTRKRFMNRPTSFNVDLVFHVDGPGLSLTHTFDALHNLVPVNRRYILPLPTTLIHERVTSCAHPVELGARVICRYQELVLLDTLNSKAHVYPVLSTLHNLIHVWNEPIMHFLTSTHTSLLFVRPTLHNSTHVCQLYWRTCPMYEKTLEIKAFTQFSTPCRVGHTSYLF